VCAVARSLFDARIGLRHWEQGWGERFVEERGCVVGLIDTAVKSKSENRDHAKHRQLFHLALPPFSSAKTDRVSLVGESYTKKVYVNSDTLHQQGRIVM
jgi:hypothetical protein